MNGALHRGISQSELARRLGISPPMVTKLKGQGMPVDSVEAADAWRRANVRTRTMANGSTVMPLPPAPPPAPPDAGLPPAAGQPVEDLWASRARKEAAEAALAELKLEQERRRLVDRAAVEAEHAKFVVRCREALLQVSARLAPLFVDMTDQGQIERMLDAEHRQVLSALAGGGNGS